MFLSSKNIWKSSGVPSPLAISFLFFSYVVLMDEISWFSEITALLL